MPIAIVKDPRYIEHDTGPAHPESADRLRVLYDSLAPLQSRLIFLEPRPATAGELGSLHSASYLRVLERIAGEGGGFLDPDTPVSAASWEVALLAAGGTLRAVDWILEEADRRAFVLCRPPGHHAEPDRGMGFCLLNNVALAASHARRSHGVNRILIVDWDVHHGNGTQRAFYGDRGTLFFSTHQYPYYPGTGEVEEVGFGAGEGFTVNLPFPAGYGDAEYLESFRRILVPIARQYAPELILVSAGFDAHFLDPLGGMEVTPRGFGNLAGVVLELAREYCSGRVLLALEGGYHLEGLRDSVGEVLGSLLEGPENTRTEAPRDGLPVGRTFEELMETVRRTQRPYWKALDR